jgi:ParB family chromosome partitioning protein
MQNIVLFKRSIQAVLNQIPIEQLIQGKYQPRQTFSIEGLESLASTIKQLGILQPIVVRKLATHRYEIVAGERRWRAAQIAGLSQVPCLVGNYTEEQSAQISLIENMSRENLNPLTEAKAIARLIEEFSYTHEETAAILGVVRSQVTNILRLLKLDIRLQKWLGEGDLSEAHGKILAGVALDEQYRLGYESLRHGWSSRKLQKVIEAEKIQKRNPRYSKPKDVDVADTERRLSDKLGYPVIIGLKKNGVCSLSINFTNADQMQGFLEKLGYE